ncbi:ferritin family protein [Chloroflexota bacterium]
MTMSISFSGNELIDIAIGIEKRGIAFYDIMARSTENVSARDVFQYLVNMERKHIQIFQDMRGETDKHPPSESYAREQDAYLRELINGAVFTDDTATSEMTTKADSDIAAIELAISGEKDSILFYYEMRDIMPPRSQQTVTEIITEEKTHLRQLSELKKKLASN